MRYLKYVLMILIIGLFVSCDKTEDTSPDDSTNPDPNPNSTPVSSAEIGYQGGVFEFESFSLEVPEGAFNGYFKLSLEEYPLQSFYGEDEASVFYQLKGVPIELLEKISISLTTSSSETLFAVLGQETKAISQNTSSINFQFYDVVKTADQCLFELEVTDIPNYSTDDTASIILGLVKNYTKVESKGHFSIYTPSAYINEALDLEQYLEEAHSKFTTGQMNFSYAQRTKWPVKVTIEKLQAGTFGYFVPSKWGDNHGYLVFNQNEIYNSTEMRLTAGHEFFHLVQALYDPRYGFTKAILPSSYYWVEEAASVYAEEFFTPITDYASSIRNGHQMAPFKGFLAGANESAQHHGYGMSAFVKYMSQQYGSDKLVKVFEHEKSGNSNIIDGFDAAYGVSMRDIYDDFINAYILGNVYNDFGASHLLGESNGTFSINSAADTVKSFEETYPSLSAKIYKIDINYAGFSDQNSLLMQSNGMKKLIYKLKGQELSFLGSYGADYTLNGLQNIQAENALILVVMVCHYSVETNGSLNLKINANEPSIFNGAKYKLQNLSLLENVVRPDGSNSTQEVIYDYTYDYGLSGEYLEGTYTSGNFQASWNYPESWSYQSIGNMQLIIDEQAQKIVSGTIQARLESTDNPDQGYKTIEISFANIPARNWGEGSARFVISGADFCNTGIITAFDEVSFFNNFYRTLISYSCNSNPYFEIQLRVAE